MKYVDRGDPAIVDFVLVDLTFDGVFHTLDLSGIVAPAGANNLVHICLEVKSPEALDYVLFTKNGNSHALNGAWAVPQIPNELTRTDVLAFMDADRKIQYQGLSDFGFIEVNIIVRGWFEG